MTYEIKKGVPIPIGTKSCTKYPFQYMEIGDCFFADPEIGARVRNSVSAYNRTKHEKFVARKTADGRIGVWRIA